MNTRLRSDRNIIFLIVVGTALVLSFGSTTVPAETCCQDPTVGDIDCSGNIDITDLSYMIDHLFLTLSPLCCKDEANFNYPGGWYSPADTIVDIVDLQLMIDGQFISMRPYPPCPSGETWPSGSLISQHGCKGPLALASTPYDITADQSCIVWDYDGVGNLSLSHINAGFNCCPTLDITVDIESGTIYLHEVETMGICFCLCLFDLEFEITDLPPGEYRIVAEEPYVSGDMEEIDFTVDLTTTPNGVHCVERTEYPWGIYEQGMAWDQ